MKELRKRIAELNETREKAEAERRSLRRVSPFPRFDVEVAARREGERDAAAEPGGRRCGGGGITRF